MRRERFLKLTAGVLLAPYLARIPSSAPKVVPAAATTLTVSGGHFLPGDIVRNLASGEALQVLKVDGRTLTVARGLGTVPAAAIRPDDDLLIIVGAVAAGDDISSGDRFNWSDDSFHPRMAKVT